MIRKVAAIFALCIFIFSCSTQHVVSDHAIQKRKYRPGLFVSKKSKSVEKNFESDVAEHKDETVFYPESKSEVEPVPTTEEALESTQNDIAQKRESKPKKTQRFSDDPIAVSNQIINKFVPMQYAAGVTKQLGKLSAIQDLDSDETSFSAILGCALGGAAVASFITGLMTVEVGIGIYLLILALVIAIAGLVFSIKGAVESGRDNITGAVLSIIGMVSNGVIVVAGLVMAFILLLILAIFAGCN